jgi:Ca-activated chloride channel family protein
MNTPLRKMILLAIIALLPGGNLFAQPRANDSPLSYGLVIDRSGSLRDDMKYVVAAAVTIINGNQPSDETFVTQFTDRYHIETLQDFTHNQTELLKSLKGFQAEGGQTALIDAVYLAAEHLADKGSNSKRALVLISDGDDRESYYKIEFLLNYLRDKRIPVYVLAYVHSVKTDQGTKRYEKALALLNNLAQENGGKVVLAEKAKELPDKAIDIVHLLHGN